MSQRSVAQISFAKVGTAPAPTSQQTVETRIIPQQSTRRTAPQQSSNQQQASRPPPPPQIVQKIAVPQQTVQKVVAPKQQQEPVRPDIRGQSAEPTRVLESQRGRLSSCDNEFGAPSTKFYGKQMSLRAPKAGDAFFTEQRREKRYDEEEKLGTPKRVMEWIARVLQGQVPSVNGSDAASIINFLRDGTVLCSLMNKLLRHANMPPIGYRKKVNSAFVAMSNLEVFIDACKRYGVPESSLFLPSDLYEGRKAQLLTVVNCLNALGCVGNARGFQPPYEEPEPPKADWCKGESYD